MSGDDRSPQGGAAAAPQGAQGGADATTCAHGSWTLRRDACDLRVAYGVRRYTCDACGAWGHRVAQRRTSAPRPVQPYDGPVTAPRPEWLRRDDERAVTAQPSDAHDPRTDGDPGAVEAATLPDARYSNGRRRPV